MGGEIKSNQLDLKWNENNLIKKVFMQDKGSKKYYMEKAKDQYQEFYKSLIKKDYSYLRKFYK